MITKPQVGKGDASTMFALILEYYPEEENRTFAAARGMVINDYQAEIEKAWLSELHRKYPVRLNEAAWNTISKN
jgi:peptidyl-prolyl cis-trans isomerase SurA